MTYDYIQVTIKRNERILGKVLFDPADNNATYERRAETLAKPYLPVKDRLAPHRCIIEKIKSPTIRLTETFVPDL